MGTLQSDNTRVLLRHRHRVGRDPGHDTALTNRVVSLDHAVIAWVEPGWTVRDLGSTNGTLLNGQLVQAGREVALSTGDTLTFGRNGPTWQLVDNAPPRAFAEVLEPALERAEMSAGADEETTDSGEEVTLRGGVMLLPAGPDESHPVFRETDGRWVIEEGSGCRAVADREIVTTGGRRWRLHLPDGLTRTFAVSEAGEPALLLIEQALATFSVSLDEEHVDILLEFPSRSISLKHRAHHYLLLLLARERVKEQAAGADEREQGWLDQPRLEKMLRLDENTIHQQIHRARKQLADQDIEGAVSIIERREPRRLRIGLRAAQLQFEKAPERVFAPMAIK